MHMLTHLILSPKSLKLSSLVFVFFFFHFWLDRFHFPVFELANLFFFFFLFSLMLNLSIELFSSVIIFFRFVISVQYLLMFSVSLLKFFLSLCIVLSSLSIFMTIILNSWFDKLLIYISLRSVSGDLLFLFVCCEHSPLFPHFLNSLS